MFKIELVEQNSQPVLTIRTNTKVELLPQLIGESYTKIINYLSEIGEKPADAPFTAYYNLDMQNLDVEMGFPVSKALQGKDDIICREIPLSLLLSLYI